MIIKISDIFSWKTEFTVHSKVRHGVINIIIFISTTGNKVSESGVYISGRAVAYATNVLAMQLTFQLVARHATNFFSLFWF